MLEQADVIGHAVAALADGGQHIQNAAVQLPGIGLTAHAEAALKAEIPADEAIHFVNLAFVPIVQVHEAGFCTGGAPAAQELHAADDEVQLFQIAHQVLHPQGCPLADGHQLGGLIVGIAQGGGCLILVCKGRQVGNHLQQLCTQIAKTVPVNNHVCIVGDVAAGGTQVDDAGSLGGHQTIGIHMGHHIVAHFLLPGSRHGKVNIVQLGFQLVHLLLAHRQPQGMLCLGKGHPQLAPGPDSCLGRKEIQHIPGGVAGGQGGFITVSHMILLCSKRIPFGFSAG